MGVLQAEQVVGLVVMVLGAPPAGALQCSTSALHPFSTSTSEEVHLLGSEPMCMCCKCCVAVHCVV